MSDEYSYEKKFDVCVVGGGVIGCSIAYHLARRGAGQVKVGLLERNTVGQESSGGAAGMLAAQIESEGPGPFLDLALESRKQFSALAPELRELTGADIEYSAEGIASVAFNAEHEKQLRRRLEWQSRAGLAAEWLAPDQAARKFPFLTSKQSGALWAPEDGQVSASRLVTALEEGCRKLGVTFIETENFTDLSLNPPRLEFIETNVSKITADRFVFATGAWTAKLLNGRVPVEPVKGQILIFQIPEKERVSLGRTSLYCGTTPGPDPIGCYFVPKGDGHLLVGATMEKRGFDKSENKDAALRLSQYATEIFPKLAGFPFKGAWVGLRPAASDSLPILGQVPEFSNLYVAGGHFRNGILLAPVTGRLMAELLLDGKTSISLDSFSPRRFASPS